MSKPQVVAVPPEKKQEQFKEPDLKSERSSSLVENLKQKLEKFNKTNAKNRQSDED